MEYKELAKYVFAMERVDWELHSYKSRKRQLVQARQISIYLANWFWPLMPDRELTELFNQDHCMVHHTLKSVKSLLFSDKDYRAKMDRYLRDISNKIKEEDIIKIKKEMEEESFRKKILDTIDSMEIIARVYADIKCLKIQ